MRIAIAQINCMVGDISGNAEKLRAAIQDAKKNGDDLIVFPELVITGYPPEDLLLKSRFIEENIRASASLITETKGIAAIWGFVDRPHKNGPIHNAACIAKEGKKIGVYHKQCLPNYGVFDELRYFTPGSRLCMFTLHGKKVGLTICEDLWLVDGPARELIRKKTDVIVSINASPYHAGKWKDRELLIRRWAKKGKTHVVYVNMVGGQDELVFDGHSIIVDRSGKIIAAGAQFQEEILSVDLESKEKRKPIAKPFSLEKEVYSALVVGTRDYLQKNRFPKAVIGLSGGIDSALVASVAVDAIGAENVTTVTMPSPFTSEQTMKDAKQVAENFRVRLLTVPITSAFEIIKNELASEFSGRPEDITEENLQARIRGMILMALSNKFGWLVLTTGNKSEMSTGYATLYGDMAGGFSVIKDVPKTLVYKLARYRNSREGKNIIPESILTKAPTAELRPNQKDQDSLPPYDILDAILEGYVEENLSLDQLIKKGYAPDTVRKVINLIDKSEYKRRQAPPGVKITPRAFGKDWRLPITNRFNI